MRNCGMISDKEGVSVQPTSAIAHTRMISRATPQRSTFASARGHFPGEQVDEIR
jgi:hypothetical protein